MIQQYYNFFFQILRVLLREIRGLKYHCIAIKQVPLITAASIIILVCGGCRVGPDYVQPKIQMPDQWQQKLVHDFKNSHGNLHVWWETFDDPILNDLIHRADVGNLDLKEAVARIGQARAILGVVSGRKYPEINGIGDYNRISFSKGIFDFPITRGTRTDNFYQLGIDTFWEVDLWGRVSRSVASATDNYQVSVEDYRDIMVTLYAEVASAYTDVRSLQGRVKYAENNAKTQAETVKLTQDRNKAKLSPILDIRQAELNLARTRAAIEPLKEALANSMHRLGVLLGKFPTTLYPELSTAGTIPQAKLDMSVSLPVELLRQRPDIRMAERTLAAKHQLIGVATADLYPQFSFSGFFTFQAVNSRNLIRDKSVGYAFGPGFRWNLFSGGRIRSQIQFAEQVTEESLVKYENTILRALQEVEDSMVSYVREKNRSKELTKSVKAAAESVELVKTLYINGLTDFQNVLDMERSLFQEQDRLAESQGRVSKNLIRLYKALGGGWNTEELSLDRRE